MAGNGEVPELIAHCVGMLLEQLRDQLVILVGVTRRTFVVSVFDQ